MHEGYSCLNREIPLFLRHILRSCHSPCLTRSRKADDHALCIFNCRADLCVRADPFDHLFILREAVYIIIGISHRFEDGSVVLDTADRKCLRIRHCPVHGRNRKLCGKDILHGINHPGDIHNDKRIHLLFFQFHACVNRSRGVPDHVRVYRHIHSCLCNCLLCSCEQVSASLSAGFHRARYSYKADLYFLHICQLLSLNCPYLRDAGRPWHYLPDAPFGSHLLYFYFNPAILRASSICASSSAVAGSTGSLGSPAACPTISVAFLSSDGKFASSPITLVSGARFQ